MIKYIFHILIILFLFIFNLLNASKKSDKIFTTFGNEYILKSDILNNISHQFRCKKINEILFNILLKYYANIDNYKNHNINIDKIKSTINIIIKNYIENNDINHIIINDIYKYIYHILIYNSIVTNYYFSIINNIKVNPNEIINFYQKNELIFPTVSQYVYTNNIIFYPKKKLLDKIKILNKLNKVKIDIENKKFTFVNRAIILSENKDYINNGLIEKFEIGHNKFLDKIIIKLKEGEISNPFESNLGFHLIKLEKINKNKFYIRNILIKKIYTEEDITNIKKLVFYIKKYILQKKNYIKNISEYNSFISKNTDVLVYNTNKHKFLIKNLPYLLLNKSKNKDVLLHQQNFNNIKIFILIEIINNVLQHKISLNKDFNLIKIITDNYKISKKFKNFMKKNIFNNSNLNYCN